MIIRHLDLAHRFRWSTIAAAAAVTLALGGQVAASSGTGTSSRPVVVSSDAPTDPYHTCLRSGPSTPDRMEARSAECRLRTDQLLSDPAFVACLRNAAGSADTIERWGEACRLLTRP